MKKFQAGFTLIELMIVVAIIGILAAIAIPAYQDYTVRTQATEGLNLAAELKAAVADFHANRGRFPSNNTSAGVSLAASITGNYVTSITVGTGGEIAITYNQDRTNANLKATGANTLVLRACENAAKGVVWVCGRAAAPSTASNCSTTTATTVAAKYLPSECR